MICDLCEKPLDRQTEAVAFLTCEVRWLRWHATIDHCCPRPDVSGSQGTLGDAAAAAGRDELVRRAPLSGLRPPGAAEACLLARSRALCRSRAPRHHAIKPSRHHAITPAVDSSTFATSLLLLLLPPTFLCALPTLCFRTGPRPHPTAITTPSPLLSVALTPWPALSPSCPCLASGGPRQPCAPEVL